VTINAASTETMIESKPFFDSVDPKATSSEQSPSHRLGRTPEK
jgi:hypothetical protein